jgi:hypothetical protein
MAGKQKPEIENLNRREGREKDWSSEPEKVDGKIYPYRPSLACNFRLLFSIALSDAVYKNLCRKGLSIERSSDMYAINC